jgi:hypothetical protein
LTIGLGIIILQGVSGRKSLAGVNIMNTNCCERPTTKTLTQMHLKPTIRLAQILTAAKDPE